MSALPIRPRLAYQTLSGKAWIGDSLDLLETLQDDSVDLVITSPPFALQRKKAYGNESQDEYADWLAAFGRIVLRKLKQTGSFVVDLGGSYEKGVPSRSLYNFRVLLKLCDDVGFNLAQDFYWHNPSKLPSPIEWVNKRKIRAKDSVNTIWWLSKDVSPKADVRRVLKPYSGRMLKLLSSPDTFYRPKERPSGHDIGRAFAKDNGGAIPSNLLQIPNTDSNSGYLRGCKATGRKPHPARFPGKIPEFFIRMLTDPGDLVVDIFAGSNTTGEAAEALGRQWRSFDLDEDYVATSVFRFMPETCSADMQSVACQMILDGIAASLGEESEQTLEAAE